MRNKVILIILSLLNYSLAFSQTKTIIGIMPFKGESQQRTQYTYRRNSSPEQDETITAIQDAVTDVFIKTKRFNLVERQKMDQIKSEKNLQKNEDFIDGTVIEQSKSLGAQYIVMGNVSKASMDKTTSNAPYAGTITRITCNLAFNIKVVDVTTGLIIASNSFSAETKGKNAFESAMDEIKPNIEKFIKDNFKITLSVASIEEKNKNGDAVKILITGGTSLGISEKNELKVYEASELTVDGKKMTRKITIGKVRVIKVEDENFSVCTVIEGGC